MSGVGGPIAVRRDLALNPATALREFAERIFPAEMRCTDWDERFAELEAACAEPVDFLASDDMGAAMVRFPIDTDGDAGAL